MTKKNTLTRAQLVKRGLDMCDKVSRLEDERDALKKTLRRAERVCRASAKSHETAQATADAHRNEFEITCSNYLRLVESLRRKLEEHGIIELPEGALRALENRISEQAGNTNHMRMAQEYRG